MHNVLILIAFSLGIVIYLVRNRIDIRKIRLVLSRAALYVSIMGVLGLHFVQYAGYKVPLSIIVVAFSITTICLAFEGAYLGIQVSMMSGRTKWVVRAAGIIVFVLCILQTYWAIALALVLVIFLFLRFRVLISSAQALERFLDQRIAELDQQEQPDQEQ